MNSKDRTEPRSDDELVARFLSGEGEAFDEIDRRYRARLVRFLRFRTKSLDAAEELAQETLVKAFSNLGRLRRGEFLSGWLYRVAFRTFVDATRRRRTDVVSLDEPNDFNDSTGASGSRNVSSDASERAGASARRPDGRAFGEVAPDERAVRSEERANLWRVAKETLTADEFRALWSRYVDGLSDRETATALGKSPGAARVALTRARKKLAEKLREEEKSNAVRERNGSILTIKTIGAVSAKTTEGGERYDEDERRA